ncbi:tyrosine-type recombinase/integrase [Alteromonas sp. C1M14]|uniref:tyrosine-type recombinase/integrase n=1 Tax=Alteromonas sp. C1M14 TaxID=2841567 RepID=UPI001C09B204|nr:tyrosine-type recombinase/integrase [Alteromonas sp. C1M14]MBU2979021.1 tyrosine-type recombinase/integrase [Alteromonas sp. C1M14]
MKNLIKEWLHFKLMNEGKSSETTKKYGYYLSLLEQFCDAEGVKGLAITTKQMEMFVGLFLHNKKLKPSSRRTAVAAVKGFYKWLSSEGYIAHDPTVSLPYPASDKKIPVAMGLKNFEKLLQQCDLDTFLGVRDAAIIALLGGCGFRVGGIAGLNQSHIVIYDYQGTDRMAIRVFEKGKKERMVPVPLEAQIYLRVYIGHPELNSINRTLANGDQVLFVSVQNRKVNEWDYYGENRRMGIRSIQKMIEQRGEKAGIPADQCHPHALRHLTGTEYAENDLDLITRQMLLGHSDPNATAIYTQMAMRKLTEQIDKANPLGKVSSAAGALISQLK